jgi:uncharacterized protein YukE
MSVMLPGWAVQLLAAVGVNWPNVDEDGVHQLAQHVRDFGNNVKNTHNDASATVTQMGQNYSGHSYDTLLATWGRLSDEHMNELLMGTEVVAAALDTVGYGITAQKGVALAQLAELIETATESVLLAIETFGFSLLLEAGVVYEVEKVINNLVRQMIQQIELELLDKALQPLEEKVAAALSGMVFQGVESALGVTDAQLAATASASTGYRVAPAALTDQSGIMQQHASTVAQHGSTFLTQVAGVSFGG